MLGIVEKEKIRERVHTCSKLPEFRSSVRRLPKRERIKRFPHLFSVRHALKTVFDYDEEIQKAAKKTGVQRSAIQAIVFREVLGFGIEDFLDFYRKNASRGICQIKPSTAQRADRDLGLPEPSHDEVCKKLRTPEGNITYCAKIVRTEAIRAGGNPKHMSDEELLEVFLRYNGSRSYARNVLAYCRAFEKYNS